MVWNDGYSTPGGAVTEMYSYHPAGAVTAKQMQVTRTGNAGDPNNEDIETGTGAVEADYTYDSAGNVLTYGTQIPATVPGSYASTPVIYTYGYDSMERPVSLSVTCVPTPAGCVYNGSRSHPNGYLTSG